MPKLKKNAISKEQTAENEKLAEKFNPKGLFPLIIVLNENGTVPTVHDYVVEALAVIVSSRLSSPGLET